MHLQYGVSARLQTLLARALAITHAALAAGVITKVMATAQVDRLVRCTVVPDRQSTRRARNQPV